MDEELKKLMLDGFKQINDRLDTIDNRLDRMEKKLDVIEEQTKNLTEFKQAIKDSANDLIKKIS